uniref:Thioredoxin domain-containing protein 9 n=1 Tax=Saccoglossus kowalevskii TaxID=10224 RepID=A0ABM0GQ08_SACKO|nr:PREDICTED: thioredoxin domain-containing protein 9-like [Saccoglossus kowalevskii]
MAGINQQMVEQQLLKATEMIESQVDAEIGRLDTIDDDELEILRKRRMEAMKKAHDQKQEWLQIGHGQYSELQGEKEFFAECKKSKHVVCHFYRDSTFRCKIIDKHMGILAPKHVETRFLKINAEKCPFLAERLRIKVIPTLALIKDAKTTDYIVGFDDLGATDDFPTEMLEWRLGCASVINYSGNLMDPPLSDSQSKPFMKNKPKKIIRSQDDDSDSDGY